MGYLRGGVPRYQPESNDENKDGGETKSHTVVSALEPPLVVMGESRPGVKRIVF